MGASDQRRWKPQSSCGPDSALTVAELRTQWEELGDFAPILVVRSPTDAHWAQHADVLMADGLVVARLFAPYAKQAQPAPGTVWPPATNGATAYRPPPPDRTDIASRPS